MTVTVSVLHNIIIYSADRRFTDLEDVNDYSYSYNPCRAFIGNTPGECNSVHVREQYSIKLCHMIIDSYTHTHTLTHTHSYGQSFTDMSGCELCS